MSETCVVPNDRSARCGARFEMLGSRRHRPILFYIGHGSRTDGVLFVNDRTDMNRRHAIQGLHRLLRQKDRRGAMRAWLTGLRVCQDGA